MPNANIPAQRLRKETQPKILVKECAALNGQLSLKVITFGKDGGCSRVRECKADRYHTKCRHPRAKVWQPQNNSKESVDLHSEQDGIQLEIDIDIKF